MAGSLAIVGYWAGRTTLCSALCSDAKQLPYQAVRQPPFPVVHDQHLCLADVEGEVVLAPYCQVFDLLPIGCLTVVGDRAYHCHVVNKLDGVGVMRGHAVVGEQEGTKHEPQ